MKTRKQFTVIISCMLCVSYGACSELTGWATDTDMLCVSYGVCSELTGWATDTDMLCVCVIRFVQWTDWLSYWYRYAVCVIRCVQWTDLAELLILIRAPQASSAGLHYCTKLGCEKFCCIHGVNTQWLHMAERQQLPSTDVDQVNLIGFLT